MKQHIPQTAKPMARTLRDKQTTNGRTLALNSKAWRDLRASVLREQPLCEHCQRRGKLTPATDVDHIDSDPSNNSRDNLASLCHECHSRKTQADMGKRVAFGCDEHGMPLDPRHHWNKNREQPRAANRAVTFARAKADKG